MDTLTRLLGRFKPADLGLADDAALQATVAAVVAGTTSYDAALLELLERRHSLLVSELQELEIVGEYRERRDLKSQLGSIERQIRQLQRALTGTTGSLTATPPSVIYSPEVD